MEELKKFQWVRSVVLIVGGYGKQTLVAVRGIELMSFKLKHSAKTGVFVCEELNLAEQSHEALMEKIFQHALRQDLLNNNPNVGAFAW